MISEREATTMLGALGLAREPARRALKAGLAGDALRLRGSLLYRAAAVQALVRPPVPESALPAELQQGCFVARIDPSRVSGLVTDSERRAAVCDGWRVSAITRLFFRLRAQRVDPMPFLATVSGFVVVGGLVTAAVPHRDVAGAERTRFSLDPPGPWYPSLHGRLVPTPPGGPWTLIPTAAGALPWLGSSLPAG
ncbi:MULTISPECIES: hypothetical protein [unclassified Nocardioides]|uniref:hypothetical protein n=1 Tax=unclassified Nocardioides TaxID=2615069 RepID=UPI0007021811|nr:MULTISPECIES: hypothetical protein [unclassified Nocardioides]KRF12600.1 hypothetical protein ASH02_13660 [Nocardioides sp. Soil796]